MPSNEDFPPPARPPVCGMLMPILIGACSACSKLLPNGKVASAAPALAVASRPRREIDPDLWTFFDIWLFSPSVLLFGVIVFGFTVGVPSDSPQGPQNNLRRQGNLRNYGRKR